MTHRKEVKEMLLWGHDRSWFGFDKNRGYFMRKSAPPEALESFKKWAAYQDSLGPEESYNYSLEIV